LFLKDRGVADSAFLVALLFKLADNIVNTVTVIVLGFFTDRGSCSSGSSGSSSSLSVVAFL